MQQGCFTPILPILEINMIFLTLRQFLSSKIYAPYTQDQNVRQQNELRLFF